MIKWFSYKGNEEFVDSIIKDEDIGFPPNDFFGIFYDDETGEWLGSANIEFELEDGDVDAFIYNFESNKKGNGKKMLQCLMNTEYCGYIVTCIIGESTKESLGFWRKMNAIIDNEEIDANECYEFKIYDLPM